MKYKDEDFIHLHVHSTYSIQDSLLKIDGLISKTQKNKLRGIALTDHGSICGMSEFKAKINNTKLKGIFGIEVYVKPKVETQTEKGAFKHNSHLILLAKNIEGWRNIIKIHNHAWNNFYYKPTTTYDFIKEHSKGLICTTACVGGDLFKSLDKNKSIDPMVEFLNSIFGEDLYLEMQDIQGDIRYKDLNPAIIKNGHKYIITNDIHYLDKEDFKTHNILMLIRDKKTMKDLKDGSAFVYGHDELYYKSPADIKKNYSEDVWQNCLESCNEIYEKIENIPILDRPHLPSASTSPKKAILDIIKGNLHKVPGDKKDEYFSRIKREMNVYEKTNSLNYLLIVHDFLIYADKNGYMRNYGRGSACSSLVTYLMGIHHIDPIKNNLYFERFLNEARGIKMHVF